ncbi:MAG: SAM-dependent methyltransferase [Armatimonadetes bacterium]|nr:SAM-dependent methyltransferase [Armatimonadota bacterium]
MSVEIEKIALEQAAVVARELRQAANRGGTEADFRREAARIMEAAGSAAGLTIVPRDEFSVARGRVDSVYNRLILEYKKPGILKPTNKGHANQEAIRQVKNYILDVAVRERREAHRLSGVVTDGFHFIFVRRVGEGWSIDDPAPVTPATTERFLRLLFSLSAGAALIPENLLEDFGPRTLRAQRAVRALYTALHTSKHPLVVKLFEQWRLFFSEATDYKEWAERIENKEEFRNFVTGMGISLELHDLEYEISGRRAGARTHRDPHLAARVFFALHTYYALLIKLVASLAAARFAGNSSAPLANSPVKEGDALRRTFLELERGGLFREYGIRNFLEGDFFGWYLAAWNEDIEEATGQLVQRLAEYDPGALELAPENARDLLKKLYHYLLPREIRHDLGEYYTPDWLAERLVRQTLGQADLGNATRRVLDPSCGSGTFLVILIKHIRDRAARKNQNPSETLELILKNVVGIDLNPLAVIAARTNYLLALGDLLKHRKGEIDIPVYQADSILTPSQGTGLFDGDVYPLKTSAGVFRIPAVFAGQERMDCLSNVLDEAVEAGIGEGAFLARLTKAARLEPEELSAAENELKALYRQLRELHEQGLNGVWARIIKNAFAPLFLEPCHYIVGNPPWVNWEHLPDEYRQQTKPLWEHYGLFPHGGMDTILGKGKKDISMLMTYVAADRYLRRGGKLGFVLSQSLFKTSGAGQGFRRFLLPDKTPFGPLAVEDMVELKPFEGATNRTAVAVFAKGHPVRYPVSYQYWKKRSEGRGSAIGFDTPYEEVTTEKVTFRKWFAEPVDRAEETSAWITARELALRALRKVLGKSPYSAHAGSFTGGVNGIYWVEITGFRPGGLAIVANITEGVRRKIPPTQAAVELDLLYPLLRGRDVRRWQAAPSAHILMTQDPATRRGIAREKMEGNYPKAHAYLSRFEKILQNRPAFRRYFRENDPYWSMFNVSPFTFSPWKVVWREVANELDAAVVGQMPAGDRVKPVIPDHTCILVECKTQQEAHYLCAAINSSPARLAVRNYIVLHPDPHVLNNLNIPRFTAGDERHRTLAALSRAAHEAAAKGEAGEIKRIEDEIDRWAARLWGLTGEELAEIKQSLEESLK